MVLQLICCHISRPMPHAVSNPKFSLKSMVSLTKIRLAIFVGYFFFLRDEQIRLCLPLASLDSELVIKVSA